MDELKEQVKHMNSNMRFLSKFVREVQRGKSFLDKDDQEIKDVFFNKKFVWKLNNYCKKIVSYTIIDDRNELLDGLYLGIHFLSYYQDRIENILSIVEKESKIYPDDAIIRETCEKLKRLVEEINNGL